MFLCQLRPAQRNRPQLVELPPGPAVDRVLYQNSAYPQLVSLKAPEALVESPYGFKSQPKGKWGVRRRLRPDWVG